jgi:DNA polymerase III subunit delta'
VHPAFSSILGQGSAVEFLSRALAGDRLPHGLVFAGPAGVGKASTALLLAKVFLADRPDDPESIDKVAPLIDARTHPDFHYVVKEQVRDLEGKGKSKAVDFSIDVVRERIVAPASRKSALGRGKVFLVEEADAMTTGAQNAMLKTLEEPAGRTLIVLLTESPGGMLPTIRSRCQLVRFGPVSETDALMVLRKRGIDPTVAANAIRLADGSPGVALRWHEDGVVARAPELQQMLDSGSGDLAAWFKAASDAYAERQLERDKLASEDAMRRNGVAVYLRIAADHLRRRLAESDDDDERDNLIDRIEAARDAEAHVDANVNVALVLQSVGMRVGG